MDDENKPKKHRKPRVIDPHAPRRPTTSFNFYMKHKSTEYINKHVGVSLGDVIKIMSQDWHKMTPEERKPYDDASTEAKKEYDKKMDDYRQTDNYKNFLQMKEDVKGGRLNPHDVPKQSRSQKKSITTLKTTTKKALASKKLNFEIFTDEFKEFNRRREEEYRKLRRKINNLEEEVENVEERFEKLGEKKATLLEEQHDAKVIERQSKRTMERYRSIFVSCTALKDLLKLTNDSDVAMIIAAIKETEKQHSLYEQIKKHISELKFN